MKSLLFFVLVSCFFYTILLLVWGKFVKGEVAGNLNYKKGSNSFMYTRLKEVETFGKIDLLFLGSSHTYRGFDTRIFEKQGIRCFNLGSSAQTPIQTNLLLKRYLDKLKPTIVIYEVYPRTFCSDGVESSLDIIANSSNDIESLKMALKQNNVKVYNTLLYAFITDLTLGNFTSLEDSAKIGDNIYVKGGYVTKEIHNYSKTIIHKKGSWVVLKNQLKAFEENVSIIKNRKIKLVLVQAPYTHPLYLSYTNNDFFNTTMKCFSEYYNYNEMINLNDSIHFDDEDHLNQLGVNVFNEVLIKNLNFNGGNKK